MKPSTRRAILQAAAGLAGGAAAFGAAQPAALNTPAPELTGKPGDWLNAAGPVTLASRLGKVTIVHFWT